MKNPEYIFGNAMGVSVTESAHDMALSFCHNLILAIFRVFP